MLHQHLGETLRLQRPESLRQTLLLTAAKAGCGLVEQQDPWSLRERPRNCEQPELTQRQGAGGVPCPIPEPDELERLMGRILDASLLASFPGRAHHRLDEPRPRPRMASDHRVSEDVELRQRRRRLKYGAETRRGATVRRPARDIASLDEDLPCVDAKEAGDTAEQRRLACAVRPDQARERAALDREIDVVDGGDGAKALRDAAGLAGGARGVGMAVGGLAYFENAAPASALGLQEAMFPTHMLSIWIALWFLGPR